MIAFYYGLTGFACTWFYRKDLTKSAATSMMRGVVPLLGAIILTGGVRLRADPIRQAGLAHRHDGNNVTIFGYGAVAVVGIGALALGLVAMAAQWITSPDYFRGLTLPRRSSADLVLVPATGGGTHLGLPDSGDMPTVIAPDLSNLPPGETAVNPETGEEFTKHSARAGLRRHNATAGSREISRRGATAPAY